MYKIVLLKSTFKTSSILSKMSAPHNFLDLSRKVDRILEILESSRGYPQQEFSPWSKLISRKRSEDSWETDTKEDTKFDLQQVVSRQVEMKQSMDVILSILQQNNVAFQTLTQENAALRSVLQELLSGSR